MRIPKTKRAAKLRAFCDRSGYRKGYIAREILGITPPALSHILALDIDEVIRRIDELPAVTEKADAA